MSIDPTRLTSFNSDPNMNFPDSKRVSGFIRGLPGQDLPARIEQLSVGTAYVQTSEMPFGSIVKMHSLKLV